MLSDATNDGSCSSKRLEKFISMLVGGILGMLPLIFWVFFINDDPIFVEPRHLAPLDFLVRGVFFGALLFFAILGAIAALPNKIITAALVGFMLSFVPLVFIGDIGEFVFIISLFCAAYSAFIWWLTSFLVKMCASFFRE